MDRVGWKAWLKRAALGAAAVAAVGALVVVVDGWRAFGARATGERRAKMEASPQWEDGHFENPQPLWNDPWGMVGGLAKASAYGSPAQPLVVEQVEPARFQTPPPTGLRVTWFGHSSLLVEIDGHRVLTDPVWGARTSPLSWAGPQRWYAPPIALEALPKLDAVVLSHDHYDHLDEPTITAMRDWDTVFIAPRGVGAHLAYWGVPEARIVELDWWESHKVGALEIVCTPSRHASGRMLVDNNATLWAGYAFVGQEHRAYFSGDTGLFPAMKEIGQRLGPFDVTMIEAGAYNQAWPDWHLGPEQAVLAHQWVRGETMLPIHWGLFNLAYHGWTEPIERVLARGQELGVTVLTPKPGQSVEPTAPLRQARWWPEVPWTPGAQDPIRATLVEVP